jgi:hypothetical protein
MDTFIRIRDLMEVFSHSLSIFQKQRTDWTKSPIIDYVIIARENLRVQPAFLFHPALTFMTLMQLFLSLQRFPEYNHQFFCGRYDA